jgi:hypothetical protein
MTQGNAMPVADDLQMPLSFLIARHLAAGRYHTLRDDYRKNFVGVIDCSAEAAAEAEAAGFQKLDELNLLAPFCLTGVCTTVGLLVYFFCGYSSIHFAGHAIGTKGDRDLRKQLATLSLSELYTRVCDRADIDQDALHGAFGATLQLAIVLDSFGMALWTHHPSNLARQTRGRSEKRREWWRLCLMWSARSSAGS